MERTKKKIVMNYEKKYKEALKDMRVIYPNLKGDAKLAVEHAFPELRESEDERIRKELIRLMTVASEAYLVESTGIEKKSYLAYLEKQKEPIDPFDTELFQDGVKEGRRLEREEIEKEQQPADDEAKAIAYREYERGRESGLRDGQKYVLDNAESYGLCKPAEWSEEDENNLELVIDCIYKFYPDPVMKYKLKEWLKSLRPVKQEWSEEDEKNRRNLMSLLANMRGDRITEETYQKYYPWLKSLRSRPKPSDNWKPSEEQPQVADASKMEQEVDLEKEIDKGIADYSFTKTIDSGGFKTTVIDYAKIARHFYKLGLKARKEE